MRIARGPAWRYVSWACRRNCGICRSTDRDCTNAGGDAFCAFWASRERNTCYVWPSDVEKKAKYDPDRLGALILGTAGPLTTNLADSMETSVMCSPSLEAYAFWDSSESAYKCCDQVPVGWNRCERRYTKCNGAKTKHSITLKLKDARQPPESIWVVVDSAAPVESSMTSTWHQITPRSQAALGMGKLGIDVKFQPNQIALHNAHVAPAHLCRTGRTDSLGEMQARRLTNCRTSDN